MFPLSLALSCASCDSVVARLRAAGRPVTCVVSAMLLPAAAVAAEHGVPLAVFWNLSAAALAAYYHYFHHGYDDGRAVVAAEEVWLLPGLPTLRVPRDLPSFVVDASGGDNDKAGAVGMMRALMEVVGREKPTVLVNTLDALGVEADALQAMRQHLDVVAVGTVAVPPVVPCRRQRTDAAAGGEDRIHLYERDQKAYTEWLDARPGRSVVYISFGSMLGYDRRQAEEMLRGLRGCGRPYLWVVPKDGRDEEVESCLLTDNGGGSSEEQQGMVLEWCDQIEVLSHPSTGCFVTHCGWNSTLEAVAAGVPVVAVPNWSDQPLNARLVEEWGVGVRAERDAATGLLVGAELERCVEAVMGDGDEARSIHERVSALRDRVRREVVESGRVEARLQNFIAAMQNRK